MFHGNSMQIKEPKVHLLSDIPCDQTTGNFVLKLVTAYSTWVAHTSDRKCILLQKVKKSMAWLPYDKLLTTPARYQALIDIPVNFESKSFLHFLRGNYCSTYVIERMNNFYQS